MYRNVCLLVLIALSASCLADERNLDEFEERCVIESKINRNAVVTGDYNNERVVPEATHRCYIGCILRERGYVHPNGTLHIEYLKEILPLDVVDRNKVIAAWEKCAHEDGGNMCETSYKSYQCLALQNLTIRREGDRVRNQ